MFYIMLFSLSALLYWLYKKFRGPMYRPGMISTLAKTCPQDFDDESLYSQSTPTSWQMPKKVQLFHFAPPVVSSPPCSSESSPVVVNVQSWPFMGVQLLLQRNHGNFVSTFRTSICIMLEGVDIPLVSFQPFLPRECGLE